MHTQDTIDAYVKGQLTPAEKAAFEADLARDPALADAVAQARLDLEVANLIIRDEVRSWMSTWAEDDAWSELDQAAPHSSGSPSSPPTLSSRRFYLWMAAAAALTLVLAAVWFFRPVKPGAEPVIVEQKDNPAPPTPPEDPRPDKSGEQPPSLQDAKQQPQAPAPRPLPKTDPRLIAMAGEGFQYRNTETFLRKGEPSRPAKPLDSVSLAAEALRNNRVAEAIRLATAVPQSDARYADAQLLLGQVYFEQKQYAKASKAIQQALNTGKIPKDQANWNLLMTLVAQYGARKQEADALLKVILSDKDHPYYEDAEALAERLRE